MSLLGSFEVRCHDAVFRLPRGTQRLLAALALRDTGVHRVGAAELLWPDCSRDRAMANLRSALWKGRQIRGLPAIDCDAQRLRLAPGVLVDHAVMLRNARRITGLGHDRSLVNTGEEVISGLGLALLPDWFDDWLLPERERWNQVRLHALETMARVHMASRRFLLALEAALAAVAIEPVRESAHRTVVEIYLAEGNSACAMQHYQRYSRLVQHEVGVAPSAQMARLIRPISSP